MRNCPRCKQSRAEEEFGRDRSTKSGKRVYCKPCGNDYTKARRKMFPDLIKAQRKLLHDPKRARKNYIWSFYRLRMTEYEQFLFEQGGVCSGCGDPNPKFVDHDHRCCAGNKSCGSCVRGILCRNCNAIAGMAKDNPEILDAIAAYLVRWKEKFDPSVR